MPKTPLSPIYLDELYETKENVSTKPNGHVARKKRKKIAFGWYGGKFSHLDWLLPLLPDAHHYCEPFSGSAAILLNRAPSPVETYNDIDGEVVNFFRVLRNSGESLVEAIGLTPFSREEFYLSLQTNGTRATLFTATRRIFTARAATVRPMVMKWRKTSTANSPNSFAPSKVKLRSPAIATS